MVKIGKLRNKPTENVVIRNCTVKSASGGVAVGNETAAMVRNVYMHDCIMENPNSPFYFKNRRPRGGGGENMWFERIHSLNTKKHAFRFDMLGIHPMLEIWQRDSRPNLLLGLLLYL